MIISKIFLINILKISENQINYHYNINIIYDKEIIMEDQRVSLAKLSR